jgi:hypothetical protein
MKSRKTISIFELVLIVFSIVSFAYFVSTDLPDVFERESSIVQFIAKPIIPVVSAIDGFDSAQVGCCKETIAGATCQDVLLVDKAICKTDLIGTGCKVVSECQKGCCYDADTGICSLNAPKESCTSFGGIWDSSTTCNIPECQVGCCILGDGAAMTTTRECTKMSNELEMNKVFKPLDSKGTCESYADLSDVGACLTDSNDYSGLKDCIFTKKENCNRAGQIFKKNYLCTSKELNTTCEKTTKTTCADEKAYFVDSCGNKANVYDSLKGKNQTYWEKVISPKNSCSGSAEFCGNCEYSSGSICTTFVSGKNLPKPEMGNSVCKNLDCVGGRKHGESWCISDADNSKELSQAVGTRSYVATCFEGEIKLEGCADFNQEICIENKDASTKKSDAMCIVNDWRSCIYANDATSYFAVKAKCDSLPQCAMFNEIPGNEKYKGLPGFKEIANNEQGRAGDVGNNLNEVITYCVPRFTPGFQFWNTAAPSSNQGGKVASTQGYGGSKSEANSICNLGSFTCVSHIKTVSSIAGGSTSTDFDNPECNMQAADQSKQKVSLMMDALNDRCRSLGSCGIQYNIQADKGRSGFTVNRMYIDKKGSSHQGYTTEGYNVTPSYLSSLKTEQKGNEFGSVDNLEDLTSWKGGASMLTQFGSEIGSSSSMINNAFSGGGMTGDSSSNTATLVGAVGSLAGLGLMSGSVAGTSYTVLGYGGTVGGVLSVFAIAAAAFVIGSLIGGMMSKGMPPGEAKVNTAAWAGGVTAGVMGVALVATTIAYSVTSVGAAAAAVGAAAGTAAAAGAAAGTFGATMLGASIGFIGSLCLGPQVVICAAIVIAAIVYALFTKGIDHEYYVTEFKCEAWQPPLSGKCEVCNDDVRPCTEFKCRSIGNNCQYFVENGEPGYCATISDIWAAQIKPWQEIITTGNNYTNVSSFGFRIENKRNEGKAVNAWEAVTFGIITDKEAICKVDVDHSKTYDQMRFAMASIKDYSTGKIDGKHHTITLSPHAVMGESNENIETTVPMDQGENEYYIICQNYAGLINDAPFTVQVTQAEGPDLTPPVITRLAPENNGYVAKDKTDLEFFVYLNEPAECRYSFESYDMTWETQNDTGIGMMTPIETVSEVTIGEYQEAPTAVTNENSLPLTCITDPEMGYYGEWMCAAFINNYTSNKKIYIECKDQPNLVETDYLKRMRTRTEYSTQVCETGLEITSIEPTGSIETNASAGVTLKVRTEGCINGGDATCKFRLPYYGEIYSLMLDTGNKTHVQPFNSLGQGTRDVEVMCEDAAGNTAKANTSFTVFVDSDSPEITRAYYDSDKLFISTDEDSECLFVTNRSIGCEFGFEKAPNVYSITHSLEVSKKTEDNYYIKCRDNKGNMPLSGCTIEIKLSDIQQ